MSKAFLVFILLSILSVRTVTAGENFRVERPHETGAGELGKNFGDIVFAGLRTPMPTTTFERWRQSYCAPFICNMVLCHGACAAYKDHCPSFAESGVVINLDASNCLVPGGSAGMPQAYSSSNSDAAGASGRPRQGVKLESKESSTVTVQNGCCR
jgi:hypothetical protein